MPSTATLPNLLWGALAITGLMGAAIWNGYPLVYSDTSSYLGSGFTLDTLVDRPITYGLFLRITSLNGLTLWISTLAQCALLWWCLSLTLAWAGITRLRNRAIIVLALCTLSGLPFVSGQLMADAFTPMLILSLLLLIAGEPPRGQRWLLHGVFVLAFAMHMSHVPLALLLIPVAIRISRAAGTGSHAWRRAGLLVPLMAVALIPMGSSLAKSKHVFFMAHMAEEGILQRYLEKHCPGEDLVICGAPSMPSSADAFLWGPDSPLNRFPSWSAAEPEFKAIIAESLRDPELLLLHGKAWLSAGSRQLLRFDPADGMGPFADGTLLQQRIEAHIPGDAVAFAHSRQSAGLLTPPHLDSLSRVQAGIMALSAVLLLAYAFVRRTWRSKGCSAALVLISAYVLNAFLNAGLVMVADRFAAKLAWTIPLAALLVAQSLLRDRVSPSS
ncbi:MAG: hypothetical protein QY325_07565 [Flavobacteriales bacterium]|nr:MAG: hypothetical protein QY325_07565 [Flavobacteriales bacterium]